MNVRCFRTQSPSLGSVHDQYASSISILFFHPPLFFPPLIFARSSPFFVRLQPHSLSPLEGLCVFGGSVQGVQLFFHLSLFLLVCLCMRRARHLIPRVATRNQPFLQSCVSRAASTPACDAFGGHGKKARRRASSQSVVRGSKRQRSMRQFGLAVLSIPSAHRVFGSNGNGPISSSMLRTASALALALFLAGMLNA